MVNSCDGVHIFSNRTNTNLPIFVLGRSRRHTCHLQGNENNECRLRKSLDTVKRGLKWPNQSKILPGLVCSKGHVFPQQTKVLKMDIKCIQPGPPKGMPNLLVPNCDLVALTIVITHHERDTPSVYMPGPHFLSRSAQIAVPF